MVIGSGAGLSSTEDSAAHEVIRRAKTYEGAGMRSFIEEPPFVWERAEGARIVDADGRQYTD